MKHIYHFGTFDVANYGDLLFPLVLEHKLRNEGYTFHHFAPTRGKPYLFTDRKPVHSSLELLETGPEFPPGAVIVGGGEIIRDSAASVKDYKNCRALAYPSLWLGAAELANNFNASLVVNAPGVTGESRNYLQRYWRWFGNQAAYLALRDQAGVDRFNDLIGHQKARLVYDTAFCIADLWSGEELAAIYRETLGNLESPPSKGTIAVHVKPGIHYDEVARSINNLATRTGKVPILIAIGPCHGDSEAQIEVGRRLSVPRIVIDQPRSIRQIAAIIANSDLFVGQSMHGYITAISFGVPPFLCFPKSYAKCAYLVSRLGLEETLDDDWSTLVSRVERLTPTLAARIQTKLPEIRRELDEHWRQVSSALNCLHTPGSLPDKVPNWRTHLKFQSRLTQLLQSARKTKKGLTG